MGLLLIDVYSLLVFILKCGLFIFVTILKNKVKYVKIKKLCGLFIKIDYI